MKRLCALSLVALLMTGCGASDLPVIESSEDVASARTRGYPDIPADDTPKGEYSSYLGKDRDMFTYFVEDWDSDNEPEVLARNLEGTRLEYLDIQQSGVTSTKLIDNQDGYTFELIVDETGFYVHGTQSIKSSIPDDQGYSLVLIEDYVRYDFGVCEPTNTVIHEHYQVKDSLEAPERFSIYIDGNQVLDKSSEDYLTQEAEALEQYIPTYAYTDVGENFETAFALYEK